MLISKSRFLSGLQCDLRIWYEINAPGEVPSPGPDTLALFDMGHEVGELAQRVYPGGGLIDWSGGIDNTISQTHEMLRKRIPIYEASFSAGNAYCRVDILNPAGERQWDLIEVKSSSQVKDVHLHDVAFQIMCARESGLDIRNAYLMHIDTSYIRHGEIDLNGLFAVEDITERAEELQQDVTDRLRGFETLLEEDKPSRTIGTHCSTTYECPLIETCWSFLPDHPVTEFYRFSKERAFSLINTGVLDIRDIPDEVSLNAIQKIQKECVHVADIHVDSTNLAEWLEQIEYPCGYLDFETVGSAIPLYNGTSPYQQIPFQFSLHIQQVQDGERQHVGYLAEDLSDPRYELVQALTPIQDCRSVLAFNAGFEKRVLIQLAHHLPRHDWLTQLNDRMIDLLDPFRKFWLYHPEQHGSCSLKAVLPAFTGAGYDEMEIASGDVAGSEFLRINRAEVDADERARVTKALQEYCRQDTQAMIDLLIVLRHLCE